MAQLLGLVNEVFAAFFDLRAAGQRLGVVAEWGGGTWGLLRSIAAEGPITMADLARRRSVSRQYIQRIANELIDEGLVALAENPGHRRSGLLTLTPKGHRRLDAWGRRIEREFARLCPHLEASEVAAAAATLARLRERLDGMPGAAVHRAGARRAD